jgi:NAD(P)-dependent dehydrogenase (short-subunit alcohol dehydrogenase family)
MVENSGGVRPLDQGPFSAVEINHMAHGAKRGAQTEGKANVLDGDGRSIRERHVIGDDVAAAMSAAAMSAPAMSESAPFAGKVAVVTGAAQGMGRAIALAFAAAGAKVAIGDVDEAGGEDCARIACAAGGEAVFRATDVRSEAQIAALVAGAVDRWGRLDVMVNNAAVLGPWLPIAEQTEANLDLVLGVNVKGTVFGMKHALAAMQPRRAGVIVNLASVQGFRVGYPGAAFYAASKAAIVSLTKSAALEYGAQGIRAVAIAPGPIDTPMLRSAAGDAWPPAIVAAVPLGRVGEADEVARAVLWLASDAAGYITGATLPIDGGFLAP